MMLQASGLYTVGGMVMLLFLSACAATGDKSTEGPMPSVRDRLAEEPVYSESDGIPRAG